MLGTARFAAIVKDYSSKTSTARLTRLLDFLGIPWQIFKNIPDLANATQDGKFRDRTYAILASVDSFGDSLQEQRKNFKPWLTAAHSLFLYTTENTSRCLEVLRTLPGCADAEFIPLRDEKVEISVSSHCPDFAGPMHGLRAVAAAASSAHAITLSEADFISQIINSSFGAHFIKIELEGLPTFVNCSYEITDLDEPLKGRFYDVKEDFLSAVPLLMYLKWAFRDSCWQANESGACLIIDDPVLKSRYGFCDFREVDSHMREQAFSTNIAFIPWNWDRTRSRTAELIRNSEGRYSISIHGCDHTSGEFSTSAKSVLHQKTALAKRRMERHREKTAIPHDLIMIFPQGEFSQESLEVLQQHQFLAAVNTEVIPAGDEKTLTVKDMWDLAILEYGSFPLFTRRYPWHGLENIAFDLLLGKPCLIVEHHQFFQKNGREAVAFISALNALNCRLRWRTLGGVIRQSYQWRTSQGIVHIKMFANELVLKNESNEERSYHIQKADHGSVGVKTIRANSRPVEWKRHNDIISFKCKLGPKTETLIEVRYNPSPAHISERDSLKSKSKIAFRRYASEFRDNFLSRHEVGMLVANRAKKLLRRR